MRKVFFVTLLFSVHFLCAERVMTLPEVLQPESLHMSEKKILIMDKETIHLYDLSKKKYVRSIGRIGQGPGEFNIFSVITLIDGHKFQVYAPLLRKLLVFSYKGEVIEEFRIPVPNRFISIKRAGKNYIIWESESNHRLSKIFVEFNLYDSDFKKLKTLYKFKYPVPFRRKFPIIKSGRKFFVYKNRIFISKSVEGGFIFDVFDFKGTLKYQIKKEVEKRRFSDEDKNKILAERKRIVGSDWNHIKDTFFFPTFYPIIRDFMIRDHKIFIKTWFLKDEMVEFIILDLNEKRMKRQFLPEAGYLFYFQENKYYFLFENIEAETFELHSVPWDS